MISVSATIVAVLVVYLIILLAIGVWGGRESHSIAGYYVANKRLPAWVIAFSSNATGETDAVELVLCRQGDPLGFLRAVFIGEGGRS